MRSAGAFLAATLRDAGVATRAEWRLLAILVAVGSAPGLAGLALLPPDRWQGPAAVSGLLVLYLQLLATARTLHVLGAMPADYARADATERRYPSAFLGSLLYLLAAAAGLVLLVVPGLAAYVLLGLWMPALLAGRLGVVDAFRRSWALARPALSGMALVALAQGAVFVAGFALASAPLLLLILGDAPAWFGPLSDILIEPAATAVQLGGAVIWAAAYARACAVAA